MKPSASIPARLDACGPIAGTMSRSESPLTRITNRCRGLEGRILRRKVPHAVLSWRYFLPDQGRNAGLHRKAFLSAWSRYPRPVWILIALFSYGLWYSLYAWLQVFSARRNREPGLEEKQGVSALRQLFGLMALAYGHATPPCYYYRYRLHRLPESRWLDFIFTHELPHWHRAMSPGLRERSSRLMAQKHEFALEMEKMRLPAVETRVLLRRGEPVPERLFGGRSFFLKPESGSRKEGCFELRFDPVDGTYVLEGGETVSGEINILIALMRQVAGRDYIAQPLLRNHPELATRCGAGRLATIRLVTVRGAVKGKAIRACLEIPVEGSPGRIFPMNIDIANGRLSRFQEDIGKAPERLRASLDSLQEFRMPLWKEVVATAEAAHGTFRDLYSIGWDLAVTDQGVKLLEGNINWAVAVHQLSGRPLLPDLHGAGAALNLPLADTLPG